MPKPPLNSSQIRWDDRGLVTVVAQDVHSGAVRMVAWADRSAVEATLESGEAHFWSRSRRALWKKGETSGNVLRVREVWVDCDADTLLYLVDPHGPSCHTGAETCFFQRVEGSGGENEDVARPTMDRLELALRSRSESDSDKSYTKSLLVGGAPKIGAKVKEEAEELAAAIADEPHDRVISEAADLIYHSLVGLLHRGVLFREVARELARRFGTSGHAEKASRLPRSGA